MKVPDPQQMITITLKSEATFYNALIKRPV